jgi:hypothetical protein
LHPVSALFVGWFESGSKRLDALNRDHSANKKSWGFGNLPKPQLAKIELDPRHQANTYGASGFSN